MSNAAEIEQLTAALTAAGQGHVLQFVDTLSDTDKSALYSQLQGLDLSFIATAFKSTQHADDAETKNVITPFTNTVAKASQSAEVNAQNRVTGLSAIQQGQVAVVLMAGGQGTRLGFDKPKGMYDIGLPSSKSLFHLHMEKIVQLSKLGQATSTIPVYIMTSIHTDAETKAAFQDNNNYGLDAENVFFFQQGLLPCLTPEGKIILESASHIALAPNGNGGLYLGLQTSGALADMTRRGVESIHVVGVDNVLVVPADPGFIGFALDGKVEASNLVCLKKEPHERVGVMCLRDGKPSVVEYSEISKSMAEAVGTDGVLVYSAANLANHWFSLDLVKKVLKTILPFHVATKAIKCVSKDGKSSAKPEKPNGIKLEMFIFDSFPLTDGNMSAYAIERNANFAPVKNKVKPGASSTPITARRAVSAYHKALAIASGAVLEGEGIFEISPLVSIAGEGLTEIVQGQTYVLPGVLTPTGYKQTTTVASAI